MPSPTAGVRERGGNYRRPALNIPDVYEITRLLHVDDKSLGLDMKSQKQKPCHTRKGGYPRFVVEGFAVTGFPRSRV